MESAAPLMYNVYRACEIGQLRVLVQTPVSGNEARVVGWGRPAGQVVTQRAGGDRCTCIGPPPLHPPSALFIAITSVRPCLFRTRETGWQGGGGAEPTLLSRSQGRQ